MTIRQTGLALVVTVFIGGVLALYYLGHKPFSPAQAVAIAQSGINIGVVLIVILAAGGLGRRLLSLTFGIESEPMAAGEVTTIAVALGLGLLGLGLLLLGALRLYYPVTVWLLIVGICLWLRRDIRSWAATLMKATQTIVPVSRVEWLAATFTLLVLASGFLRALAPPVMWDALVYHLALPDLYTRTHSIWVNPSQISLVSGMPQLTEMLYTAANLLRMDRSAGGIAAQLLGYSFGVFLCLGLATHARRLGLPGWLAPALLLSSWTVVLELAWAYAELLLLLMALAMLLALSQWRRQRADRRSSALWLGLAGVFAGLACGCKYTGIIVPLGGVAAVITIEMLEHTGPSRARLVRAFRSALIFGSLAFAIFTPWLVKNGLLTGSPFYPLLWPAADMDALRQWFYHRPDLAEPLGQAMVVLIRATFLGVQSGNEIDATIGPLLLMCAGLLVFAWSSLERTIRNELVLLLCITVVAYVGWVLLVTTSGMGRQVRQFFAILPFLSLLGAAGLAGLRNLDTPSLRLSTVANAAFALVLGLSTFEFGAGFISHNPLPYLVGIESATDFQTSALGWYIPTLTQVNELPAGSRVVFLWEPRSLECAITINCSPDVTIDRWWHARRLGLGAVQIESQWRAEQTTHVLIYDAGVRFVQSQPDKAFDPSDWDELYKLRMDLKLVARLGDAYSLYELPSRP